MSYQTGTATSSAGLVSIIQSFATSGGFTLSGGYLSAGNSHTLLTAISATHPTVTVTGATNSSGANVFSKPKGICINSASWPITYELYGFTSPNMIVCILKYEIYKIQTIIFGDIKKINNSAYGGGSFFHATKPYGTLIPTDNSCYMISEFSGNASLVDDSLGNRPAGLFTSANYAYPSYFSTPLYIDIDGIGWNDNSSAQVISITDYTASAYFRGPNTWNGETILVPIHLQYAASSSLYMYLGMIENLRYIRMDNYNTGDSITIGSDVWYVYPWFIRDTINRNGLANAKTTGTLGFAVKRV